MALNIEPGSRITVTIMRDVRRESALKTLSRLFAKDPVNRKLRQRRKKLLARSMEVRRRGGRPWEVRPKAPPLVRPIRGAACRLVATPDVIGDLRSVARFVEVSVAK